MRVKKLADCAYGQDCISQGVCTSNDTNETALLYFSHATRTATSGSSSFVHPLAHLIMTLMAPSAPVLDVSKALTASLSSNLDGHNIVKSCPTPTFFKLHYLCVMSGLTSISPLLTMAMAFG